MKYGPFDGIYFPSKSQFYKYIATRIIHHKYRTVHRFIPLRFGSRLLADALFKHHPNFIDRKYSYEFGFMPLDKEEVQYQLCVIIGDEWIPFAYKKILNNA